MLYDFSCECGEVFELEKSINEEFKKKDLKCPKCNSKNIKRIYNATDSMFRASGYTKTSTGSHKTAIV